MNIVVLGAGRVGGAIVRDLSAEADFNVKVVDLDPQTEVHLQALDVDFELQDLSRPAGVVAAVRDADLVVGCVPGFMGYATVAAALGAGKPVVDISFFEEDAFGLDALAKEQGVPCLVDCGVAPGLSNLILGHMEATLDETHSFRALIGGLPVERDWPWEYKAPFSPRDVIQEYVRPARMRRQGQDITLPALSEVELVHFPASVPSRPSTPMDSARCSRPAPPPNWWKRPCATRATRRACRCCARPGSSRTTKSWSPRVRYAPVM